MPEYAGLFRKMPVNANGMDFTHKCRHFPNPDAKTKVQNSCAVTVQLISTFVFTIYTRQKISSQVGVRVNPVLAWNSCIKC